MKDTKHYHLQTWEAFRASGLGWFINRMLHIFGWVIVFELEPHSKKIINVLPARTTLLGFTEEDDETGHNQLKEYLKGYLDDPS